jgi:hypothetical protein
MEGQMQPDHHQPQDKQSKEIISTDSPQEEMRAIHLYFMKMSAHHLGLDLPEKYQHILNSD